MKHNLKIKNGKIIPSEDILHKQIAYYLRVYYPNVMWRTDFAAGIKMSIYQAKKHKSLQMCKAWPDLAIVKPMRGFNGLFIELKKDQSEVFLKDGISLRKDEHIQEQSELLKKLMNEGYLAVFGCGFDHSKAIIDNYLKP